MKKYLTYSFVIWMMVIPMSFGCSPEERAQFFDQAGISMNQNATPTGSNNPTAAPAGTTGGNGAPGTAPVFDNVNEQRFSALLTSTSSEKGNADYRERGTRRRLKVELENAAPGSMHAIFVNGINVGELTVGPLGTGEVEFDTQIQPDHVPWPGALPTRLSSGASIQVGSTNGTLGV